MPTPIIMPALGISQDTGRLIAWLKQEGDSVSKGEPIMEIETDKTTVEIEAPASGVLSGVSAHAGDDVPVGNTIAVILASGEVADTKATEDKPVTQQTSAESAATPAPGTATPVARRMASAHGVDVSKIPSQGQRLTKADVLAYVNGPKPTEPRLTPASPKARRLAAEQEIDLATINGSGPTGAVIAADVLNHLALQTYADTSPPVPANRLWQRMAQRLTESWQTVPHFYLKREVDVSHLVEWRTRILARTTTKVTYTDLLIKLIAAALRHHPHVNGQWSGEGVMFNEHVTIGLAVALDEGLLVPVIHQADKLSVTEIASRRADIVERAQSSKLKPSDLQDGTFTLSNLGMFGIDEFNAIVNPPQAAILAVGRIAERAVPLDGQLIIRPIMTLNLSCDHRAVDGLRGAQFLSTLADYIDDPLSMLD